MQISHLDHCAHGIWCKLCGKAFPMPGRFMVDQHKIVEAKERLAVLHACGSRSTEQREAESVRMTEPNSMTTMDRYWTGEVNRLFAAQSGGSR